MNNSGDQHNRGGFFAFVFSIVFCLVFFIYVSFMHPGVDLKEVPVDAAAQTGNLADGRGTTPENSTTQGAENTAIDITKISKPWVENIDVASYGKTVYKNNCAVCHGNDGKGDGPAGAALVPPPRNFIEGKWKHGGSSSALFTTVQNGMAGTSMASFKHLPKADRWAVVQYIRSITKNKETDDAAKLDAFAASAE